MENIRNNTRYIEYAMHSATKCFIFGYAVGGKVYACKVENGLDLLPELVTVERASSKNGGGMTLRYKASGKKWEIITSHGYDIIELCTVMELEELAKTFGSRPNRGNAFEKLVALAYGGKQNTKQNLCYKDGGDININGVEWQVKYHKASIQERAQPST